MKEQYGHIQEQSDSQANGARARRPGRFGNYELIRRIDVGGMGEVYLARQLTAFEREVAVKIMRSDLVHDPLARRRFLHEAEVSAHLLHEHILTLIEFSEENGRLFLVTPYIKGGTLAQRLRREPLTLGEVYQLFKALVQAVAYIHKHGVIHRDLKPGNVLLDSDDASGEVYVRLIDFGIASSNQDCESLTLPGQELGTAAYMAPERLNGITAPFNDIYSLGVILYEMVTGRLPSTSGRPVSPPQPLNSIVRCSMAVNPEERYQSAEELLTAFEEAYKVMSNKIPQVRKPSASSPGLPQVRKPSASSPGLPPLEKKSTTSGHVAAVKADQSGTLNEVLVHRGEFVLSPMPGQGSTFRREDYEAPTTYIGPARSASSSASLADAAVLPSQPLKPRKPRKKLSRSFLGVMAVVIIAILFVVGGMAYTVFQASISANVVITPRVQTISQVLPLTANPNLHSVDITTSSLPAITLDSSQTVSQTGQTTVNQALCSLLGICQQAVTRQDIKRLGQQAKPAAQAAIQQDLQQQAHADQCTTVGDVSYTDGADSSNLPAGTISNTVTVTQTEQGSVECVKTQVVQSLAHTLLQQRVPQNYALLDQTIRVGQFTVQNVDMNGIISLAVPVAAVVSYQILDQELHTIQLHISGMTPVAAKAYIATMPGVDASSISIRLSFGSTIPTNVQQIYISRASPTNLPAVQLPRT